MSTVHPASTRQSVRGRSKLNGSEETPKPSKQHPASMHDDDNDDVPDTPMQLSHEYDDAIKPTPPAVSKQQQSYVTPADHLTNGQTRQSTGRRTPEDTPTRLARQSEKSQLADLNGRLELYILRQRERDASLDTKDRQVEALKKLAAEEIMRIKDLHLNELKQLRATREKQASSIAQLEAVVEQLQQQAQQQAKEVQNATAARSTAESKYDALYNENRQSSQQLHDLQSQLKHLQQEHAAEKALRQEAEKLVKNTNNKHHKNESLVVELQSTVSTIKQELRAVQDDSQQEVQRLQTEISRLMRETSGGDSEVRAKLSSEYAEQLRELRSAAVVERDNAVAGLKAAYDEKLGGYRTELERIGHELESERAGSRRLRTQLKQHQDLVTALQEDIQELTKRAEHAEQQLTEEKRNPELLAVVAQKNEIIRQIKASFKRKDAEFDELMDLKILLDMELRAYRTLLDGEEKRLEIGQYAEGELRRKKQRTEQVMVESSSSSTSNGSTTVDASQEIVNHDDQSVVISEVNTTVPSLTLTNNNTEAISLYGWQLRNTAVDTSDDSNHALSFGKRQKIQPNETLTIVVAEEGSNVTKEKHTVVWSLPTAAAALNGIELVNADGIVVSEVKVTVRSSNSDLVDVPMETSDEVHKRGGCIVM